MSDVRGTEVLAGQTAQLGPAHTDTLRTKGNLACLLAQTGDLAGARPLFEEVAVGLTAQLGPTHPHTQQAMQCLAGVRRRELGAALAQPGAAATEAPVVVLKGLVGGAEHNGKRANVLDFVADRGRFKVQLLEAGGRQQLRVKPANIEVVAVPVGLAVGVGGLVGAAQHNGKRGTVASQRAGPDFRPVQGAAGRRRERGAAARAAAGQPAAAWAGWARAGARAGAVNQARAMPLNLRRDLVIW